MNCPFPGCENEDNIPQLDNSAWHLIVAIGFTGHTHIHGPIDDESMMRKVLNALVSEGKKNGYDLLRPAARPALPTPPSQPPKKEGE